jgi:hypothetical protein
LNVEFAWLHSQQSKRSQRKTFGIQKRNSGIEPESWPAINQGVVVKARIFMKVVDVKEEIGLGNRMGATTTL